MGHGSSNAIRQHRVLEGKLVEAKKLAETSQFNIMEDNSCEIGIVGSGVGYYYARSVLTPKVLMAQTGLRPPLPSGTHQNVRI
jgi:TPP-dependent indolepyruvate ferredoxin oxidoreductase alpha subunit